MNQTELWAETDELAELIIQSPEIVAFHEAEKHLKAHPKANQMMTELRDLQAQVADFQARKVPPKHFLHLLKDSESLLEELEKIPEVIAFQRAQQRVNDLLKSVTDRLAQAVLSGVVDDEEDNRV